MKHEQNGVLRSDVLEIVESLERVATAFEGKTILLTGGRGFLGRYFTDVFTYLNSSLFKTPCKLLCLDNLITAGKIGSEAKAEGYTFINHDVIEPYKSNQKIDFIIHAAGIASPFYYRAFPLETLRVAIQGTQNMLELAKEHNARFVFFSSSEIYGDPDPKHVPIAESYRGNVSCLGPRACYDESKRVGETLCQIYHTQHGVHTNTIRPFNVFGPGMQEKDYRVMPNFASRIKANKPLHVYGRGDQTRTFCYISDAMQGFLRVVARGVAGEPYNIGNPKPEISMLDLCKVMEESIGRKLQLEVVEYPDSYPADEPMRRCPDITKAEIQLGFVPRVTLAEGVKRFLTWTDKTYCGE